MRCVLCNSEMIYTREENGEPYLYCWSCQQKTESLRYRAKTKCKVCNEALTVHELYGSGMCWWCEADANDPDPYTDDSLNEVNMGRFDDDPPEYM